VCGVELRDRFVEEFEEFGFEDVVHAFFRARVFKYVKKKEIQKKMAELFGAVGSFCKIAVDNKAILAGLLPSCLHKFDFHNCDLCVIV